MALQAACVDEQDAAVRRKQALCNVLAQAVKRFASVDWVEWQVIVRLCVGDEIQQFGIETAITAKHLF